MSYLNRSVAPALIGLALIAAIQNDAAAQVVNALNDLQTRAERTDYEETSTYEDVQQFLQVVASASPRISLTAFGTTFEGRSMPLAVVGDVEGSGPEDVLASGKTRVFIQANIHAGEVCGKEAMLMFLRDVAQGQHAELFDSLVLLIAPIYNADGNDDLLVAYPNIFNEEASETLVFQQSALPDAFTEINLNQKTLWAFGIDDYDHDSDGNRDRGHRRFRFRWQ